MPSHFKPIGQPTRWRSSTGSYHVPGRTSTGTIGYAAPEQLVGKATPRSDFYGLASTLIHLATRKAPWEADFDEAATLAPLSPKLKKWVLKARERKESKRHADARQACEALQSRRPTNLQPFLRKAGLTLGAIALVTSGLAGVEAATGVFSSLKPHPKGTEERCPFGASVETTPNGREQQCTVLKDGKRVAHGVAVRFSSQREDRLEVEAILHYQYGVLHGPFDDVKNKGGGLYANGKKTGQWADVEYGSKAIGSYLNGARHGPWVTSLRANSEPSDHEEGSYQNGQKVGVWVIRQVEGTGIRERARIHYPEIS